MHVTIYEYHVCLVGLLMANRDYSSDTVAMLWSRSGGICAYPECDTPVIKELNGAFHIVGEIAHIHAISPAGPRANPTLSKAELNDHPNLLLLCAHHHTEIDKFRDAYPPTLLLDWKLVIERRWQQTYAGLLPDIRAAEIEMVITYLLGAPMEPTQDLRITRPAEKIAINGFSPNIANLIGLSLAGSSLVEKYVEHQLGIDPDFPERLKSGFSEKYMQLVNQGFVGDSLFHALWGASINKKLDPTRQTAMLAILVYLFQKCEIFEK